MSEKERKKTITAAAAKPGEKTSGSKPAEKSTGKSSERSLKKESSKPTIEKKGSKANVGEKEKSAEPAKSKSKKTLENLAPDGDKKDKSAPVPVQPTIPKEISDILKCISDETNGIVKSYLDTLEAIIKEIHLEQSTKNALETGYYFYRIQELLLRGATGAFTEIHSITSKVLGDGLSKLKSKTKTLHSTLTKQNLSSEDANRRRIDIEKNIIAALMQKCKEEEAREDKTFVVVNAQDDDDFDRKLIKGLENRSEIQQSKLPITNSKEWSGDNKAIRSVNQLVDVKIFVAPGGNHLQYRQELAKASEFESYSSKAKLVSQGEVKLRDVGS